jgi:hypothetical protein
MLGRRTVTPRRGFAGLGLRRHRPQVATVFTGSRGRKESGGTKPYAAARPEALLPGIVGVW